MKNKCTYIFEHNRCYQTEGISGHLLLLLLTEMYGPVLLLRYGFQIKFELFSSLSCLNKYPSTTNHSGIACDLFGGVIMLEYVYIQILFTLENQPEEAILMGKQHTIRYLSLLKAPGWKRGKIKQIEKSGENCGCENIVSTEQIRFLLKNVRDLDMMVWSCMLQKTTFFLWGLFIQYMTNDIQYCIQSMYMTKIHAVEYAYVLSQCFFHRQQCLYDYIKRD